MSQQTRPTRPVRLGVKIAIGVAIAAAMPLFTACGSSGSADAAPSSASTPGPAQKLADLDGDKHPADDYQHALDALAPKCTQDEEHLAALANGTFEDLRKNNVTDESELSVLQHLSASVPKGAKTDCQSVAAAYAVLREQH